MKKRLVNIILFLLEIVLIAGTVALCMLSRQERSQRVCEGMRVTFTDNLNFITEDDVKKWIEEDYGHYVGCKLDSLNLDRMEKLVDGKAAVRKSEVYTTSDGILNVSISQREPVLKFDKDGLEFYVDERGYIFPLQRGYESSVPVISGAIPVSLEKGYKGEIKDPAEEKWMKQTLAMMGFLSKSRRWNNYVGGITVSKNGDLMIKPVEGRETIIFGTPDLCAQKLELLEKYYDVIKPSKQEGYYSTVNVKYRKQIICRK